jgi:hypothetical protein
MNYIYTNGVLCHDGTKGMKWGIRRYQNKDGTLTEAGKLRYGRDKREKNKRNIEADPHRWVREDTERAKKVTESTARLTSEIQKVNDKAIKETPKKRANLSEMTDKELRDRINRELLERQYNDMFTPQTVHKGREVTKKILEGAGTTLAITGSALGVALAIKELTGK